MPVPVHLIEGDYPKEFPSDLDSFPTVLDNEHYIDAWLLNSAFSSLSAIEGYLIGWRGNIERPLGTDIEGYNGVLDIPIPEAYYPAGLYCHAHDANLVAENIKADVDIFGVIGSLAGGGSHEAYFTSLLRANDGYWTPTVFQPSAGYTNFGYSTAINNAFLLFPLCFIPQGATITSATLLCHAAGNYNADTCNAICYFNAADSATAPTSVATADALSLTDGVVWSAIPHWASNTEYESPDLSSALQQVIDRPDYAAGSSVMLVIKDNGSTASAFRGMREYYQTTTIPPRLHVTWTE
jgi:hypothetical protein